ncbi:MAG: hypothetical protein KGH64_03210 [Candidatus Micrarchaeota archaeon]|nr:hypothetical protein [Candidatus Micrarchaeota archaeon]MDE1834321.1 hypothetical protein [Candidatus Micrarchaeota archaeon]MDE1859098.1 hypothetical protein [Candidatus Micrarchaeota archaeon]
MRAFDRNRRARHKEDVKIYRKALGDAYKEALRNKLSTERKAQDRLLVAANIAAASSFMGVKAWYDERRGFVYKPVGLVSRYRIGRAQEIGGELYELFILRRKEQVWDSPTIPRKYLH